MGVFVESFVGVNWFLMNNFFIESQIKTQTNSYAVIYPYRQRYTDIDKITATYSHNNRKTEFVGVLTGRKKYHLLTSNE